MALKLDKSKMVRSLARKNKLVPHLEKALAEGDFEWEYKYEPKETDEAWHPSMHCTPSVAELYHIAKNPQPESISASLYKTFQVGHFWHQFLQHIVSSKLEFADTANIERRGTKGWGNPEDENWWSPFHWVTGSGDIAPCSIPVHGDYLVDFKTMKGYDFKPQDPPAWTADKWECQVNIYMDFFDIERALILGIQKDSPHEFKEFEYKRNQPLIDALYKKWELVSACLDEDVEPPADEEVELPLKGPVT